MLHGQLLMEMTLLVFQTNAVVLREKLNNSAFSLIVALIVGHWNGLNVNEKNIVNAIKPNQNWDAPVVTISLNCKKKNWVLVQFCLDKLW